MFKGTSDNSQHRARGRVLQDRENSSGVDESSFAKTEGERASLVERKMELQKKSGVLKNQIAQANVRKWRDASGSASAATLSRWTAELANVSKEANDIDARLTKLKAERRLKTSYENMTFERCFLKMAKQMLAEEIFDRIFVAASHYYRSETDGKN